MTLGYHKRKNMLSRLLIILLSTSLYFGISTTSIAQIRISKEIHSSEIQKDKSLYLIDFWATWCVPCANVAKYLTYMQNFGPKNLHILSLSQENPETVEKHLKKHPSELSIAIDFEGETFKKYGVQTLPYAVLLDAKGNTIWEGNPAALTMPEVERYAGVYTQSIKVDDFIQLQKIEYASPSEETNYAPVKWIEIKPLDYNTAFSYEKHKTFTKFSGSLKSILSYLLHCSKKQIVIEKTEDKMYELYLEHNDKDKETVIKSILRKLKLKVRSLEKTMPAYNLQLHAPVGSLFWDTKQIQWAAGTPDVLIGDTDLQANDIGFGELLYHLSALLEKPVVLAKGSSYDMYTTHDWQFHHKFFNLMQSNLQDNFGIEIQEEASLSVPIYEVY